MKNLLSFLLFGLVGGFITLLGGLIEGVTAGILIVRIVLAIIICTAAIFGLLYALSKTLLPELDLFSIGRPNPNPAQPRDTAQNDLSSSFQMQNHSDSGISAPGSNISEKHSDQGSENYLNSEMDSGDPEIDQLVAASKRHSDSQPLTADELARKIDKEAKQQSQDEMSTLEGQMRNADSKELANLVRHSMNEGQ